MKKYSVLTMLLLFVSMLFIATPSIGGLFDEKNLEGAVMNVSDNILTIQNKSTDKPELSKVEITTTPETKYDQIESLNELKKGDMVKVRYKEEQGKKVAVRIFKSEAPLETPHGG